MSLFQSLRQLGADADEATIQATVGNATVKTMPEVAKSLGLAPNTIRQSWKPAGMPGEPGNYNLAEIVAWRLRYEQNLRPKARAAGSKTVRRLNALEQRVAALEARFAK